MPKKIKKKASVKKAVKKPRSAAKKKKAVKKTGASTKPRVAPQKSKPRTAAAPKAPPVEVVEGTLLGKVEDFYSHVQVMALILKSDVAVGDTIRVKGHTTDIVQKLDSMQINHAAVTAARAGESVGIKINERCRKGDRVYKI